jgi:hypothetical protein
LARVLEILDLPVETTIKKNATYNEETGVDTKMESAEPADSRNQTDLTGA